MLLSLNWLKEYVKIPKTLTPAELGLKLTMHTVEIDSVMNQAERYANIVIGKIMDIKPHPDADRLQLVTVNIGKDQLEIVCGASNISRGDLVPVAMIGAKLPD